MKTKTKTKQKILKVLAICILFLGNSQLMAQTVTTTDVITQTVCVNTLAEPYEVIYVATSNYAWSIVDQSTGLLPAAGVANITPSANDWLIYIDWNQPGVYELSFVETDAATLCEASPVVLTITVEDNSNAPIASNPAPICLGDPNPAMLATTGGGTGNSVFNWYADNAGSPGLLLIANSSTYTDPIPYPIDNTYTYWVTEESANGCEGTATLVSVIVTPLPLAPTLANLPYEACFGLTNPLFTASGVGTNFNWYDNLGAQLANNAVTYTSTEVTPGTYTYFVEEVVGSCTSQQATFTFIIHTPPAVPSITPLIAGLPAITICEGEIPQDFVATGGGGTFAWYDSDPVANPGSVAVGNGTPFTPTQTAPGIYDYWLTETNLTTTCVSNVAAATFIVNELPVAPIVAAAPSAVICDGDLNPIFTAAQGTGSTGTSTFEWYDDAALTSQVGTGLTFQPTQTVVDIYTFYVIETNSTTGCDGLQLSFTFEIISLPSAPTYTPNPHEICYGDANPALTPTGSNLLWYDIDPVANPGAVAIGTGASFTPPVSAAGNATTVTTYPYWVVDQPGTCISPPLQVDLQINPLPTPGPIWHN